MTLQHTAYFIHRHYKLFIGGIALVLLFGVFMAGSFSRNDRVAASTHNQKYFKCIDIGTEDSLWSIADTYITEEYSSMEAYIDEVKSINNLNSDIIYSGATLVIPYYAAPK
jgi:hypothetical protein